ncbi:TonB-dependent receptor domain-containing protein [Dyella sp.]|uniref:TonB-dependent receptor domain-containing protein n=1 Tax=Dyella sp. TaxID=1869338 RepID=UPI002B5172B8|nr:TonB-dependent receptor [Dyella sp.]HTC28665.1 TonB-dependent receptor [Dyella sp.]
MRVTSTKSRTFSVVIAAAVIFQATAVNAQHAADNPISAADDAYGLTLGLESVGLYSPGLVRGFNPQAAGNVRIDGLYFDQQGALSNRVIEDSTIKVGVSEIGYAFPAPTGIVDYDLRHAGGDVPSATIIANVGPDESRGVSIDGSLPVIGSELVLPIGVSTQVSTQTPSYGPYPGYTSNVTSIGATPRWSPNDKITVRAIVDWQQTSNAKTFPLYFTAGDFLPPSISKGYLGQNWAEGRNVTMNLGGIVSAQLTKIWLLKAGVFRSTNDYPVSFADQYTNIQPNGQSEHLVVGYPDQDTSSNSGEVRLTGAFLGGDWGQQLIFMARGRDTNARYGGEDVVDEGPAVIGTLVELPEPDFIYSAPTNDHTQLWSVGSAYHLDWRKRAEFEIGIQDENYRETVVAPGIPDSGMSAHLPRAYSNAAFALAPQWTLYAGYTQGLENSGAAPNSAKNSGAVLPASKTWQIDSGIRYVVTPKFKIIAGVFELQKPYFNLDTDNIDRELGVQRAKGVELSIAGELAKYLHVNIGVLDGKVSIVGSNLAAEKVGFVAVGQPLLTYVANINYDLPWLPAASMDVSATHFGTAPASIDNGVYSPAVTLVNLGGRYQFTAFGKKSSLRLQIQNLLATKKWTTQYTPGFFQWPPPRTVFAYITTDLL